MFTKAAKANIAKTGNVWGFTPEYFINRTFYFGRAEIRIQGKRASNFMGRFGGGWNFKLGVQFSNWKCIIFNCLVFTITFKYKTPAPQTGEK